MLASAHCLESLSLSYEAEWESYIPPTRLRANSRKAHWARIGASNVWPNLKYLRLGSVTLTKDHWAEFLERHKGLTTLCLSSICLRCDKADCHAFFHVIREKLSPAMLGFANYWRVEDGDDDIILLPHEGDRARWVDFCQGKISEI